MHATVLPTAWADAAYQRANTEWRRQVRLEAHPAVEGPPDEVLEAATNRAERKEAYAEHWRRVREAELRPGRAQATLQAASDPLDVTPSMTGRAQSSHQDAVLRHLYEDVGYEWPYGAERLYPAGHAGRLVPFTGTSMWVQASIVAVYQAVIGCWVELRNHADDVATAQALRRPPRQPYLAHWESGRAAAAGDDVRPARNHAAAGQRP